MPPMPPIPLARIYVWANAVLFGIFALVSTVSPLRSAAGLGYAVLDSSGRSEFVTAYGGLHLGLTVFFVWAALAQGTMMSFAVRLAVLLFAPIAIYRLVSVLSESPVSGLTITLFVIEVVYLLAGVAVMMRGRIGMPAIAPG